MMIAIGWLIWFAFLLASYVWFLRRVQHTKRFNRESWKAWVGSMVVFDLLAWWQWDEFNAYVIRFWVQETFHTVSNQAELQENVAFYREMADGYMYTCVGFINIAVPVLIFILVRNRRRQQAALPAAPPRPGRCTVCTKPLLNALLLFCSDECRVEYMRRKKKSDFGVVLLTNRSK